MKWRDLPKCDCCGKFRKASDLVIQEETSSDGFQLDQWLECKFCMSDADLEHYKFFDELERRKGLRNARSN